MVERLQAPHQSLEQKQISDRADATLLKLPMVYEILAVHPTFELLKLQYNEIVVEDKTIQLHGAAAIVWNRLSEISNLSASIGISTREEQTSPQYSLYVAKVSEGE